MGKKEGTKAGVEEIKKAIVVKIMKRAVERMKSLKIAKEGNAVAGWIEMLIAEGVRMLIAEEMNGMKTVDGQVKETVMNVKAADIANPPNVPTTKETEVLMGGTPTARRS